MHDGWNVIRETTTTDTGTSTDAYVWGLDVSGTLHGAGGIGGLLLWKNDRGSFLYLYDANGNVGQLVNSSPGAIAARYEYDPFGNTLIADGPEAQDNVYRFSTKPYDAETGLYYYIFRYYSPKFGRWMTRDPSEEQGGLNLYGFVGNDPIGYIDYLGLDWLDNLSNFVAGAGDSLTFGLTRQARKGINFLLWGGFQDPSVDPGSIAYIAGEVTEVAIEISVTVGGASLRHVARHTAREVVEAGARPAFRRAHHLVGGFIHHVNPIKGHIGRRAARFPLPFRWAAQGFWNMRWVPTRAAHLAEHARLMRLESLVRLGESTILIRQSINRIVLYLEQNEICWDSLDVQADISGEVELIMNDEIMYGLLPLSVEVSEESSGEGF